MIQSAQDYISEGFGALPLKSNKSPMLPEGHNYLYSIISEDNIDSLFMRADKIGIACGQVSDGFMCLDFDCHGGQNISQIFNEYMRNESIKNIIDTHLLPVYKTPSGGYHIYFKGEVKNHPGMCLSRYEDKTVMIEVRGHGQYVCLFPSSGYKKLCGSEIIKVSTISNDERDILFSVATSFNQAITAPETEKKGTGKWPDKFDITKPIGRYNETEQEHAKSLLLNAGWKLVKVRRTDNVEMWLRPGKEENSAITHSATFGKFHNMFYVYTESDSVFKSWTSYSLFDILLKLKFNGNFKEATDFLSERYQEKTIIIDAPEDEDLVIQERKTIDFPIEVFPKNLQTFINMLNDTLNYSKDFLALSAMFTVATINGNTYKLRVKNGWIAPSVFWFAILGEPGTMKTHPVSMMTGPLSNIDKDSKFIYDNQMNDYEMLSDKERKGLKKPRFRQTLISDYTLEALHGVHDFNKRGIGLYKDELIGFLNDMNKYRKGSDEQFWLESFNNKSYIVNRVTKEPLYIDNININIIGTIQPLELNKMIINYGGNGLIDRFLYSGAEREIYPLSRKEISQDWIDWWYKSIENNNGFFNYGNSDDCKIVSMTPDALELFYQIDSDLIALQKVDNITANMRGYINKMKTYLPRFALLMALFDLILDGTIINVTLDHMERANKIIQYFTESAKSIFNESEATMEIAQVNSSMNGKTKKEKIIALHNKGFKNVQIAKELNVAPSNVSAILKKV